MKKYFFISIAAIILVSIFSFGKTGFSAAPADDSGCTAKNTATETGWSCQTASATLNCVTGLCSGADTRKCCKAKAAGTTGTGTTGAGTTSGGGNLGPILPECATTGRCSLCDLIQVGVNFGKFLFGIVGALVLLYFFYGGFLFLTSGGGAGVKKGKDVLVNSVIGILIVFFAYAGVNFIIAAVAKQGFNWQAELVCKPLPPPFKWTAPSESQGSGGPGAGGGAGGAPAGGTPGGGTPAGATPPASTGPCTASHTCDDTNQYCHNSDTCKPKSALGGQCDKNYTFAKTDDAANKMCVTGKCYYQFCLGQDGTVEEGGYCMSSKECKFVGGTVGKLVCKKTDTNSFHGTCIKKQGNGGSCKNLILGLPSDGDLCITGTCASVTGNCS